MSTDLLRCRHQKYDISFRQIFTARSMVSLHVRGHVTCILFRWSRSMLHVHISVEPSCMLAFELSGYLCSFQAHWHPPSFYSGPCSWRLFFDYLDTIREKVGYIYACKIESMIQKCLKLKKFPKWSSWVTCSAELYNLLWILWLKFNKCWCLESEPFSESCDHIRRCTYTYAHQRCRPFCASYE